MGVRGDLFMKTYLYKLTLTKRLWDEKNWTKKDEEIIEKHFLRIKNDIELGKIIHVGKTMKEDMHGFGIVVFKCEDEEEANAYMQDDIAIKEGLMTGICLEYKVIFQS